MSKITAMYIRLSMEDEDMEVLKHFKKIESYGANSGFPVYGGRL